MAGEVAAETLAGVALYIMGTGSGRGNHGSNEKAGGALW